MKKLLAILLVCIFAFSVVACDNSGDTSSDATFQNSSVATSKEESSEAVSSEAASSDAASSEATSSDTSSETSEPVVEEDVIQFISWKGPFYNNIQSARDTDGTSLELNVINKEVPAGKNGAFNYLYGETVSVDADHAAFTFTYNHAVWGYVRSEYAAAGEAKDVAIPADGFVAVVAKENVDKIDAINAVTSDVIFFPHGFKGSNGLDATIMKAEATPAIDGKVDEAEYGLAIWEINPESQYFSYAQFEVNNYNAVGKVYMTYDADNLYIGIVMDTPDHYCSGNAGDLWKETAVQFNVSAAAPSGDYLFEKWFQDNNSDVANQDAYNSRTVRQYCVGYDATNNVEVVTWYFPNGDDNKAYKGSREGQITTYEIAIPWTDLGAVDAPVAVEAGTQIGFGLCINSGNEETAAGEGKLQTITMRDGGSVIGVIDHTKMADITLG